MAALRPVPADAPDLVAALEAAQLPTEDLADGGRALFALNDSARSAILATTQATTICSTATLLIRTLT